MTLEINHYEDAFADLMKILMCENSEIFEKITNGEKFHSFRNFKFDLENMTNCWAVWCSQNVIKENP